MSDVHGWDEENFVSLLEKLIGEAEFLQNKPPHLIPQGVFLKTCRSSPL